MLNFVRCFFVIYWDDHVILILYFVNVAYHVDWFANIEPWTKSHFIMMYALFYVLLNSFFKVFLHLCSPEILACYFLYFVFFFFFFCGVFVWFWYQGNVGLIEWVWKCSLLWFFGKFEKDRCLLFFKCLVEFPCKAVWSWTFVCWEFFD